MDTYCAINRAEWEFPETVEFCNLRRARALPLFALDGWRDGWMKTNVLAFFGSLVSLTNKTFATVCMGG